MGNEVASPMNEPMGSSAHWRCWKVRLGDGHMTYVTQHHLNATSNLQKFNENCATTNMVSSETIVTLPLPRDQEKGGRTSSGVRPRYHTLEAR